MLRQGSDNPHDIVGTKKTKGGLVLVHPTPRFVNAIPVTTPLIHVASAIAIVLVVNPMVDAMLTVGIAEYPTPPVEIVKDEIVPHPETTAVAAAEITVS